MKDIGKLIKDKRLEKKLTLQQVGDLVGVGASTVRKWEEGMISNMGRDKIYNLCKALDISPLLLIGLDPVKVDYNKFYDIHNVYEINESGYTPTTHSIDKNHTFTYIYGFNNQVSVPIKFKDYNLKAIEILDDSMNKIIVENSIVLFNQNLKKLSFYDNKICAVEYNNKIIIHRLIFNEGYIVLNPESHNNEHKPIFIKDIDNIKLIGNAIWHYNSDKIENYY